MHGVRDAMYFKWGFRRTWRTRDGISKNVRTKKSYNFVWSQNTIIYRDFHNKSDFMI